MPWPAASPATRFVRRRRRFPFGLVIGGHRHDDGAPPSVQKLLGNDNHGLGLAASKRLILSRPEWMTQRSAGNCRVAFELSEFLLLRCCSCSSASLSTARASRSANSASPTELQQMLRHDVLPLPLSPPQAINQGMATIRAMISCRSRSIQTRFPDSADRPSHSDRECSMSPLRLVRIVN